MDQASLRNRPPMLWAWPGSSECGTAEGRSEEFPGSTPGVLGEARPLQLISHRKWAWFLWGLHPYFGGISWKEERIQHPVPPCGCIPQAAVCHAGGGHITVSWPHQPILCGGGIRAWAAALPRWEPGSSCSPYLQLQREGEPNSGLYDCAHFSEEDSGAQRGQVACLGSQEEAGWMRMPGVSLSGLRSLCYSTQSLTWPGQKWVWFVWCVLAWLHFTYQWWDVWGFLGGASGREPACNAGNTEDMSSIPGSGRSPGGGHGSPLQYSCLEDSMDRGAWWATVHGVTNSRTWLSNSHTHAEWSDIYCQPH